ncbi:MAG TPA: hypothetical protein VKQ32_01940 [Polyangia bacterium]|nr:hypothetical protein [Polyangia bacterium]
MRSFDSLKKISLVAAALALFAALGGCDDNNDGASSRIAPPEQTTKVGEATLLPPTFTEQQCTDLVSSFPGWASVQPMPEYDAQGRPTLFYAVIPITAASQLDDLALIGVDVQPEPIFVKVDPNAPSDPSVTQKSTCGKYEIHWALVPGPMFNAIKTATLQESDTIVDAIVVQPVPDVFADTSITYQGVHPASYKALSDAGYLYMGQNAPPPNDAAVAWSLSGAWHAVTGAVSSTWKKVVRTAAGLTHEIPDLIERGIGWLDCRVQGCVNLRVNLDIRNTDSNFGGSIGKPGQADTSTRMVRAWGSGKGNQMQLPGVTIAAVQQLVGVDGYGINMRFEGTTNSQSSAGMEIRKGKATRLCMVMENDAATLNDYFTRTEICGLEAGANHANVFQSDSTVNVKVQNNYVNLLAQFIDSRAYLHDVVGYTPRKLSALVGSIANTIGKVTHGRAMTPCLDFPNVAIDGLDGALIAAASAVPGVGTALAAVIAAAEVAIEVDMWLPDDGGNLSGRGIPTHEYGHFAMCSLLYDEDWTAMVDIPSLMIQRISEGTYMDFNDQTSYIMEGWADFFLGQVASGGNYFSFLNELASSGVVQYCDGTRSDCMDWNYVEDTDHTDDGFGSGDNGFHNQVRRIATTLFDAFDGQTGGGNLPSQGDFWTAGAKGSGLAIVPSAAHNGDAGDEVIALPGAALRTFIHNWTHRGWLTDPTTWAVDEYQFFGALNQTIRGADSPKRPGTKYSWCDACEMFGQHDGLSCSEVGFGQSGGTCTDPSSGNPKQPTMSWAQKVDVCVKSPTLPGFIGAPPAGSDPTSACSFTGCPTRSILVGQIGDPGASCMACGPRQVATGVHPCTTGMCATASSSATTCVDCGADQIVGGADGNTCVSCPAFQVPSADAKSCLACGAHQVAQNGVCVACPVTEVAMPDNTCQTCPAGQVPMSNNPVAGTNLSTPVADTCIPAAECTCTGSTCRTLNKVGICVNVIG